VPYFGHVLSEEQPDLRAHGCVEVTLRDVHGRVLEQFEECPVPEAVEERADGQCPTITTDATPATDESPGEGADDDGVSPPATETIPGPDAEMGEPGLSGAAGGGAGTQVTEEAAPSAPAAAGAASQQQDGPRPGTAGNLAGQEPEPQPSPSPAGERSGSCAVRQGQTSSSGAAPPWTLLLALSLGLPWARRVLRLPASDSRSQQARESCQRPRADAVLK
jgi:hypothetical protein